MPKEKKPVATLTPDDGITMKRLLTKKEEDVFANIEDWSKSIDQLEDGVQDRPMMLETSHEAEHFAGGPILAAHWGND